jgi:hypothetical protein
VGDVGHRGLGRRELGIVLVILILLALVVGAIFVMGPKVTNGRSGHYARPGPRGRAS